MIKGSKHDPASNEKNRLRHLGKLVWNKGKRGLQGAWNKGKPSPWTSKRNLERNHLMRGEKAYHWKGGQTRRERKILMARIEYKQWRINILERDLWTCQSCQSQGVPFEVHHIKSWVDYPELRYAGTNGVTLCVPCHNLTKKKNK
jgi:5-methylcytosine-specific restriction endonuclease McrA